MYDDFWSEFEDTMANTGMISTIPLSMKTILTAVGYNCAFSFLKVTEEKLDSLETYIETNVRDAVDLFDEYKLMKPFIFLPGHRSLILGIQEELLSRQELKKPKSTKHRNQPTLTEHDLRVSLINQVSSYAKDNGVITDWSAAINEFQMTITDNTIVAQCSISCPICGSVNNMRYNKHWMVSNLFKHLRQQHSTAAITKEANGKNGSINRIMTENRPFIITVPCYNETAESITNRLDHIEHSFIQINDTASDDEM